MQPKSSRYDPASFSQARKYFSEITGISETTEFVVKDIKQLRTEGKRKRLIYPSHCITVVNPDGNRFAYMQANNMRFDQIGIIADHFIVTIPRPIEEFGLPISHCGTFKEDAGGGCHYITPVYQHKTFFFAPIS